LLFLPVKLLHLIGHEPIPVVQGYVVLDLFFCLIYRFVVVVAVYPVLFVLVFVVGPVLMGVSPEALDAVAIVRVLMADLPQLFVSVVSVLFAVSMAVLPVVFVDDGLSVMCAALGDSSIAVPVVFVDDGLSVMCAALCDLSIAVSPEVFCVVGLAVMYSASRV